jgi:hypothetical protein
VTQPCQNPLRSYSPPTGPGRRLGLPRRPARRHRHLHRTGIDVYRRSHAFSLDGWSRQSRLLKISPVLQNPPAGVGAAQAASGFVRDRALQEIRTAVTVKGSTPAESGFVTAWTGLRSSRAWLTRRPFLPGPSLELRLALVYRAGSDSLRPAAQGGAFCPCWLPADVPNACRRACGEHELGRFRLSEESRASRNRRLDGVWSGWVPGLEPGTYGSKPTGALPQRVHLISSRCDDVAVVGGVRSCRRLLPCTALLGFLACLGPWCRRGRRWRWPNLGRCCCPMSGVAAGM